MTITLDDFSRQFGGILAKLEEQERALAKAEKNLDKELSKLNNVRQEVQENTAKFPTRVEIELKFTNVYNDLDELKKARNISEGKASMGTVYFSYFLALMAIILAIMGLLK